VTRVTYRVGTGHATTIHAESVDVDSDTGVLTVVGYRGPQDDEMVKKRLSPAVEWVVTDE